MFDEESKVGWKFVYDASLYYSELFKVNKRVRVEGITEVPDDLIRGRAPLKLYK
ncbi:hypothetical protein Bbad01_26600 [Bacillus badius]|nr:hypothetical protein Bbad01_26600 [Bacillus badius]